MRPSPSFRRRWLGNFGRSPRSLRASRPRFFLAPVGAVALVAAVVWGVGTACTWPDYVAEARPGDGSIETSADGPAPDVRDGPADASYTLPDGRVCTGHDEDSDGVPDQCDNCPNVSNPTQGTGNIGAACAPSAAFATSANRILFDPFTNFSATGWKAFPASPGSTPGVADDKGFFGENVDNDSFVGGTVSDMETPVDGSTPPPVLHFTLGKTGAGASSAIVTTVLTVQQQASGNVGILMRVTGDPQRFYICAISTDGGFAAAHVLDTGCTGGPCAPVAFVNPDGGSTQVTTWPAGVHHAVGDLIGVRASVTTGGATTNGTFECRVFDPSTPGTLQSSDASFSIKVDVPPSRWLPSGEVGLYAQRAKAQFFSVDVLAGP